MTLEAVQPQSTDRDVTYEDLIQMAQNRGKIVSPGTKADHDAFIHELDGQRFDYFIRQYRIRSIFGIWPSGKSRDPRLPKMDDEYRYFIRGQLYRRNYLEWLAKRNPQVVVKFLEDNPGYPLIYWLTAV